MLTVSAFGNGIQLNGVGTRANSMGNAYTAIADDTTALFWNPAGLADIDGKLISGGATGVWPRAGYSTTGIDIESSNSIYPFPTAGFAWGGLMDGKLAFGVSAYVPAGIGVEYDAADVAAFNPGVSINWKSKIGMFEFAPGVAYTPIPQLTIGAAFYLDYVMMNMWRGVPIGPGMFGRYTEESTGFAYSGVVGVKVRPIDMLSFGVVFKPKRTVTMSGTAEIPELPAPMSTTSDFDREMAWPMEVRGGGAVMPIPGLTFAVDARYIFWEDTADELVAVYADPNWAVAMSQGDGDTLFLHWEDTLCFNIGTEYQINPMFAVRGGYYYEKAPGPDSTHTILLPGNDMNAVTGGAGITVDRFDINLGCEYVMGKDREIPTSGQTDHNMVGTHTLNIIVPSLTVDVSL
jgi:long-chain fatty acid transport protein